jgi:hypothetical protein
MYIKFRTAQTTADLLQSTNGRAMYEHSNGETSTVRTSPAGIGLHTIRVANLPPEVPSETLKRAFDKYGPTREIREEKWSSLYRYKVKKGIQVITLELKQHIPSHMYTAGHRTVISYTGQLATC